MAHWTHHEDGSISVGRVLDEPRPVTFLPAPKPCTRCKQPAVTGTPRGRAVHPGCEGWLDRLTDQAEEDVLWHLITTFGVTTVEELT